MINLTLLLVLAQASMLLGRQVKVPEKNIVHSIPDLSHSKHVTSHKEKGTSYLIPELLHSTFVTSPSDDIANIEVKSKHPKKIAREFMKRHYKEGSSGYKVKYFHKSKSTGVTHVYLRQIIDKKEVFNGDINININSKGQVISYGDSFYRMKNHRSIDNLKFPESHIEAEESRKILMKYLKAPYEELDENYFRKNRHIIKNGKIKNPFTMNPSKPKLGWIQLDNGKLEAVWNHQVLLEDDYLNGCVSLVNYKPVYLVSWKSSATFDVVPFGAKDIRDTDNELVEVEDPEDDEASPFGWLNNGVKESVTTSGNNAMAVRPINIDEKITGEHVVIEDSKHVYKKPFDKDGTIEANKDAAVVNIFYHVNKLHDIFYKFGFTEPAGNFQVNNRGKKGKGKDPIFAYSLKNGRKGDASFITPPDGKPGFLKLNTFNYGGSNKDPAFDSTVLIHEVTHGLSNRLIGGKHNADCLVNNESRGLGEGWSDALSNLFLIKGDDTYDTKMGIGSYPKGKPTMRKHMYTTDDSDDGNPVTYSWLNKIEYSEVHAAGEVWASIIYEVYWRLRKKLPHTDDWLGEGAENPTKYANTLLLKLLIEGMMQQNCHPTFINARDSILEIEALYTKKEHQCRLWKAFAKRGLGINAKRDVYESGGISIKTYVSSKKVPKHCRKRKADEEDESEDEG